MIYIERETGGEVFCPECGQGFDVHSHDGELNDGNYAVDCLDCNTPLKIIVRITTTFIALYGGIG